MTLQHESDHPNAPPPAAKRCRPRLARTQIPVRKPLPKAFSLREVVTYLQSARPSSCLGYTRRYL